MRLVAHAQLIQPARDFIADERRVRRVPLEERFGIAAIPGGFLMEQHGSNLRVGSRRRLSWRVRGRSRRLGLGRRGGLAETNTGGRKNEHCFRYDGHDGSAGLRLHPASFALQVIRN